MGVYPFLGKGPDACTVLWREQYFLFYKICSCSLSLSFVFFFFKFTAWINFYSLKQGQSDDFPVLFLNLETIIRLRQPIQALI